MKRTLLFLLLSTFICINTSAKGDDNTSTTNVLRINAIAPGVEYEAPLSSKSVFSTNVGLGGDYAYSSSSVSSSDNFGYLIAPFLDLTYKKIYNQSKRLKKGKNIEYNSGNYWGIRFLTSFKAIKTHNMWGNNTNFMVGPVWGIQRAYRRLHLRIGIGSFYNFDTYNNKDFYPVRLMLSIGFNAKSWK